MEPKSRFALSKMFSGINPFNLNIDCLFSGKLLLLPFVEPTLTDAN